MRRPLDLRSLTASFALFHLGLGCQSRPGPGPVEPPSSAAAAMVERIGERLPAAELITPGETAVAWHRAGKILRPSPAAGTAVLPDSADGSWRLEDPASHLAVRVTLPGLRPVAAQVAGGLLVYPEAHPGGHLLQRPRPDGLEDFLYFERRPARARIDYRIELEGVRGLRLVAGTLELLDQGGAPRLRATQPYVIGRDQRRLAGTLTVEGCAVETGPRAPWGHAPVPPGADHCTLRVSWPEEVAYPALVDPGWTYGGTMAYRRANPAVIALADGRILAAGGRSSSTVVQATAELYDPATDTWAQTGSPAIGRSRAAVQRLADERVLAFGGLDLNGFEMAATELYDPASGLWSTAGNMTGPRYGHVSAPLPDGRVLTAGGDGPVILKTAELFDPATGLWTAAASLTYTRVWATGTALLDGRVLVAGGQGSGGATGELYDPTTGTWTLVPGTMGASLREDHAATRLPDGRVLLTGGHEANILETVTTVLFDPAANAWVPSGNLVTGRRQHRAVLLPSGQVLVAGGSQSNGRAAELYDPATGTFTGTSPLHDPRHSFGLVLAGGAALAVGGNWATTYYSSVELYHPEAAAPNGATCRSAADCASGACIDGNCCDTTCTGLCDRCNLPGAAGTCSPADDRGSFSSVCGRYYCNGSGPDCPTSCTANADCTSGSYCSGGQCVARWAPGTPCQPGDPCTGACVDGVCCNGTCGGPCDSCNQPGFVGQCRVSPQGSPGSPSCSPVLCDGVSSSCVNYCSNDSYCAPTAYCVTISNSCVQKKANGSTCTATNQCLSGFCVDGRCCDAACGGQCEACNAAGSCQPVTGAPLGGRPACASDGSTCGGACDGSQRAQCRYPGGEAACRAGSCSGGVAVLPAACQGTGACPAPATAACAPYLCGPTACRTSCATDGDCAGGFFCEAGTCAPRRVQGAACSGANQCQTGFCTDGVCCDGACGGGDPSDCQACAVALGAASDGTCAPLAAGRTCRGAADVCDLAEACDGSSPACPADGFAAAGTVCRGAAGPCDVAETCSGGAPSCPSDAQAPAGTICRAAAGPCDVAESCSGTSASCPADAVRPGGFVCRAAVSECDVPETCNGAAITCPADVVVSNGTRCNDGNACTKNDACSAGLCVGRLINGCH